MLKVVNFVCILCHNLRNNKLRGLHLNSVDQSSPKCIWPLQSQRFLSSGSVESNSEWGGLGYTYEQMTTHTSSTPTPSDWNFCYISLAPKAVLGIQFINGLEIHLEINFVKKSRLWFAKFSLEGGPVYFRLVSCNLFQVLMELSIYRE